MSFIHSSILLTKYIFQIKSIFRYVPLHSSSWGWFMIWIRLGLIRFWPRLILWIRMGLIRRWQGMNWCVCVYVTAGWVTGLAVISFLEIWINLEGAFFLFFGWGVCVCVGVCLCRWVMPGLNFAGYKQCF